MGQSHINTLRDRAKASHLHQKRHWSWVAVPEPIAPDIVQKTVDPFLNGKGISLGDIIAFPHAEVF
jgi:hypothetical protein